MPDTNLINSASLQGTYNSAPLKLEAEALETLMIEDLTIERETDKEVWANGLLTYTITVSNGADYDYEDVVFEDVLDIISISFVADSFRVNGISIDATYDDSMGILSANIGTIGSGQTATITFQVHKI